MAELYDLEEQIMSCWNVTNDIDLLFEHVVNTSFGKLDHDQISNILLGLKQLYDIKFNKMFSSYEEVLKSTATNRRADH